MLFGECPGFLGVAGVNGHYFGFRNKTFITLQMNIGDKAASNNPYSNTIRHVYTPVESL